MRIAALKEQILLKKSFLCVGLDIDLDNNIILDCYDQCSNNPEKSESGIYSYKHLN